MQTNPLETIAGINWRKENAKDYHFDFMKYCWVSPSRPLIEGIHTADICNTIDKAIERYRNGVSSRLIIKVPFRHGKSDIVSRYLPPHYLGMFPDNEVMVATYAADLSNTMSRFARSLIERDKYSELYPNIRLDHTSYKVTNWKLEGYQGSTHWAGVGGPMTGKGYDLGVVDDYLKNRQDAESVVVRDKQWRWFTNVFLTRAAPVSITIILATPWHVDDILGRIASEMKKDPEFPKFEVIRYPAFDDKYSQGILFPERFPKKWYTQNRSALGPYGTASLMQCEPQKKEGNTFKVDKIKYIDASELPEGLTWVRGWDLASTEKELIKDDPDYTAGVLMAVEWEYREEVEEPVPHVFIKHVKRNQLEAPERNDDITKTSTMDGPEAELAIEIVAGYKDAYVQINRILSGIRTVNGIHATKDKMVRAVPVATAMEAGNVSVVRGEWNHEFVDELAAFPGGKHDDMVDAMSAGFDCLSGSMDDAAWKDLGGIEGKERQ